LLTDLGVQRLQIRRRTALVGRRGKDLDGSLQQLALPQREAETSLIRLSDFLGPPLATSLAPGATHVVQDMQSFPRYNEA
jgi:hypothetical protein